jgi:hypothetical protein
MFIYALINPNTNIVRYIGKTKNTLRKRLSQHIHSSKYKKEKITHKENWIRKLLENNQTHIDGYNPDLVIKVCKGISKKHRGFKFKFNDY